MVFRYSIPNGLRQSGLVLVPADLGWESPRGWDSDFEEETSSVSTRPLWMSTTRLILRMWEKHVHWNSLLYWDQLRLPGWGNAAVMLLTEVRCKQERADPFSLLQPPSLPLASLGAKPNREPAGEAEMWFAESHAQLRVEHKRVYWKLSTNNLINWHTGDPTWGKCEEHFCSGIEGKLQGNSAVSHSSYFEPWKLEIVLCKGQISFKW